jgi:hypothetical protein
MGHLPYLHFLCVWLHGCTVYVAVLFAGALPVLLYVACLLACVLARPARLLAAYVPAVAAAGHSALCEHSEQASQ